MSIALKQIAGALVTPLDDARLYSLLTCGGTGIVAGAAITHLGGNQLKIAAGWGVCQGRMFEIEEETILATVATTGTVNGRLLIHIDVSSETPVSFVTQAAAALPELTVEDINGSGTVCEIALATYSVGELAISGLTAASPKLESPGVGVYTQTKTGTVHALAGSGANGRMLVTAAFAAGDTVTVNGTAVATVTGADSALTTENIGTWVTFVFDGTQLNFKQGGLSAADKALLIPANIREGVTIHKVTGSIIPATRYSIYQRNPDAGHIGISFNPDYLPNLLTWSGQHSAVTVLKPFKIKCIQTMAGGSSTYRNSAAINGVNIAFNTWYQLNAGDVFSVYSWLGVSETYGAIYEISI